MKSMQKEDKKAQGLSINAIILIVLGILILVVLILGFAMGWDKIVPWINPSNNIQEISEACSLKCGLSAKYDFCSQSREIKLDKDIAESLGIEREFRMSCVDLSEKYPSLGIEACEDLCDPLCSQVIVSDNTDPTIPISKPAVLCLRNTFDVLKYDNVSTAVRDNNATHYCTNRSLAAPSTNPCEIV